MACPGLFDDNSYQEKKETLFGQERRRAKRRKAQVEMK
jgi:hypothetical protein